MKRNSLPQVRIDEARFKQAKAIQAEVKKATGRELSLALIIGMAVGIGLTTVRKSFLPK
jgi:hypothetical protein